MQKCAQAHTHLLALAVSDIIIGLFFISGGVWYWLSEELDSPSKSLTFSFKIWYNMQFLFSGINRWLTLYITLVRAKAADKAAAFHRESK